MASLLSATRSISLSRASSSSKSKSKLPVQRLPELDAEQPAIPRAWKGLNGDGIVQSIPSPRLTTVHARVPGPGIERSEEHTSELQSRLHLVCRLLLEKKKNTTIT